MFIRPVLPEFQGVCKVTAGEKDSEQRIQIQMKIEMSSFPPVFGHLQAHVSQCFSAKAASNYLLQ
jgi:hypothetical protein